MQWLRSGWGIFVDLRESRVFKKVSKLVSPLIPEPRPQTLIDRQARLQGRELLESSGWHSVREDLFHWSTQESALKAVSNSECVWWKNGRGAGRFAYVRGDVDATVKIRVRQAKNESSVPDRAYQFGGLMLRTPKSNGWLASENYVFNVLGHRGPNGMQVETKSTHFGWSNVSGFAWPDGDAFLRLQRTGTVFTLYARDEANHDWTRMSQYERPDLPELLELGIIAYAYDYGSGYHNLAVFFDDIDILPQVSE